MSKVFANIGLSLDGYMAPEGMTLEHWSNPGYKHWGAQWGALMSWVLELEYFRENLKFGPGGKTGPVNDMFRHTMQRSGASIMGKRMFEQGEVSWPEEAPFHTPVFVLTHEKRAPWVRPGGTTFHFVTDGPLSALEQARDVACWRIWASRHPRSASRRCWTVRRPRICAMYGWASTSQAEETR